jgi:hypothetical protein
MSFVFVLVLVCLGYARREVVDDRGMVCGDCERKGHRGLW